MNYTRREKDYFWPLYLAALALSVLGFGIVGLYAFSSISYGKEAETPSVDESPPKEYMFSEVPQVYKNSLTYGWDDWSWNIKRDFQATVTSRQGTSIKIDFQQPHAGFALHAPGFDTSPYQTLKLSVFRESAADLNLHIEAYSPQGVRLWTEPLAWYAPQKKFPRGDWLEVTIPLENLNAARRVIGGFAVVSDLPATTYLDDIRFSKEPLSHPRWVPPPENFSGESGVGEVAEIFPPLSLRDAEGNSSPFESQMTSRGSWRISYGFADFSQGFLLLSAAPTTNSGLIVLRGGESWQDYEFRVRLDWGKGITQSLVARLADNRNYIACNFSNYGQNVFISEVYDGKYTPYGESPDLPIDFDYAWRNVEIGIRVRGNTIECLRGNTWVLRNEQAHMPARGTVGIETWEPRDNVADTRVKSVHVHTL